MNRFLFTKTTLASVAVGALVSLWSIAPAGASPLLEMGEDAELLFVGGLSARYDDNIFLDSANRKSDMLFVFSPGLELRTGRNAKGGANLIYRHDFYQYIDESDQNTNNPNLYFNTNYEDARFSLLFRSSIERMVQNTSDVNIPGQLVRRNVRYADGSGEYRYSPKTSFGGGISYRKTSFPLPSFNDSEVVSVPLDVYYEVTPKVDMSVGYRFRNRSNSLPTAFDSDDHFVSVGARGEFTPKLSGQFRTGYQLRKFSGRSNQSGLSVESALSYEVNALTSSNLYLYRDFSTSSTGAVITTTGGSLGIHHDFNALVSGNAGGGFDRTSYATGRRDETYNASLGLTYSPNVFVDLSAGYVFRRNESSTAGADFTNNVVSVTATLRY